MTDDKAKDQKAQDEKVAKAAKAREENKDLEPSEGEDIKGGYGRTRTIHKSSY